MNNMNDNEMKASGLNMDTFGDTGSYANSWTSGGGYSVPGYTNVAPESITKESKGLEIATLVFGILAIVICCCNGLFGLIGVILGIIALAKGKRSGIAIAGLVCSVLGLLAAVFVLVFSRTEYGKEAQKAFLEGFEQGYESTSGEDINVWDDEDIDGFGEEDISDDSSIQKHEGTVSVSDEVAGKVVINGDVIQIPCKLSDILEIYEVSEYSEEDMDGGLASLESKYIFLTNDGEENGVFVGVENRTEQDLADVKDGSVCTISIDNNPEKDAEILGGIKLGMSESQLEDFLGDMQYNKSETDGVLFYDLFAGDNNEYYCTLEVSEGEVTTVTLYNMEY